MRKAPPDRRGSAATVRCAIYTRKSSEEGLEQAFNSLDAQREACEAYVLSQKHEGWTALPQLYDDGGVSGGSMDRPALKRLLADVAAGRIDTVVVYKVDRLTRSLGDFAKIVEVFDAHRVSFVSVTQQFNTTTSMGRLTLNMLLSFAQFEREVTGERIRDKIAASKKKGMWMGGLPPLGYDVADRRLVVNAAEAATVRHIFCRYLALGSVRALQAELDAAGIVSKRRVDRFGRASGGRPLARGALYLMLSNRLYRGEIVHRDASYPGEHEPIVDEKLWEDVQTRLAANRVERRAGVGAVEPSLLAGLVHDDVGEAMTPTHASKKGTRYRYYVSRHLIGEGRCNGARSGWRVPAADLESLTEGRIIAFLRDGPALFAACALGMPDAVERQVLMHKAAELAGRWPGLDPSTRRAMLQRLVARITLRRDAVEIALRPAAIAAVFDPEHEANPQRQEENRQPDLVLSVPARLQRAGMATRLLVEGASGTDRRAPDRSLLRLVAMAQRLQTMMIARQGMTITALAAEAGVSPSYFTRVVKLGFLAPDVVRAILDGSQPPTLTAKRLMSHANLAK
ncbi:MAG TPA: recombinase family protein, partial [Thermohalobaculum sp.]|nr:recombinase family protein [Thermohalobaculum sp.]